MKKTLLYMLLLSAPVFVACDEDFNKDVAGPQAWEQEEAKNISFTASPPSAIDLNKVTGDVISLCTFTAPSVENATITGYGITVDGRFSLSMDDRGQVKVSELQDAVISLYGKRPEARTMTSVAYVLVDMDGQAFRASSGELSLTVTPKAPFIDKAYYLIGNMNGWTADEVSKLIKLNQSGDVYENPLFSTIIDVPADCYWKIVPQARVDAFEKGEAENVWGDGILGCAVDGDDALTGNLVVDGGAIKINDAGWVKIELNMMEYTYTVTTLGSVSPYMYVPGNHQGWNPATAPAVYSTDFMNYTGFVLLDGEFKFTSKPGWDGTNYGAGATDGTLSTGGDAANLNAEQGFYLLRANISSLTWSASKIETFGIIGNATAGGWDTSTPMTFDSGNLEYTVITALTDGEFKFRANDAWEINLGGDMLDLTFGGDNIAVTTGVYKITLSLSNAEKFTCKMEKQ
ncbi:MAG: DUF5115 domain-containing protein [Tannerella sp.]|jgi:hypothetical protein|nr:DUF5115 domain-containing protein [Tannerella sp.]